MKNHYSSHRSWDQSGMNMRKPGWMFHDGISTSQTLHWDTLTPLTWRFGFARIYDLCILFPRLDPKFSSSSFELPVSQQNSYETKQQKSTKSGEGSVLGGGFQQFRTTNPQVSVNLVKELCLMQGMFLLGKFLGSEVGLKKKVFLRKICLDLPSLKLTVGPYFPFGIGANCWF